MDLVRKTPDDTPAASSGTAPSGEPAQKKVSYYRNPMHPDITSKVPARDEMGMDYVPVYEDEAAEGPRQGTVRMAAGADQKIGVTVAPVETRELFATIRAPSRVAYDPNLYSAILEYREARKSRAGATGEHAKESGDTLRAARLRLRQTGLSDAQIADIEKPEFDASNLLLGKSGGRVWVYADIYEYESALVKPGQEAEFSSPSFPGELFTGTVRAVDTIVNSETRTVRARIEVPDPKAELRPELFLSGTIHAGLGRRLAVPETAVLDTGVRQLAYVQTAPGEYQPREVRVGRNASGYCEVLSGLTEGEKVVTSANFLIDSESKIRGAAAAAK
ncbi:MAG: efflux RND transporter periplasmic adaptor subunit [Elusimicrobia bacterium]|nr:efflux RND transporter periplasmic adaptor subunit [Elusimicrobiota bacterium]